MKSRIFKMTFMLMMAIFALSSCSEDDVTVEEFPNWQETNDQAFADTIAYARNRIAAGDSDWKIFLNWSLENQNANTGSFIEEYDDDCRIVVKVIEQGTGSGCPMYTDSVKVHYRGRLLPSTSYSDGYVFAETYSGEFNEETALPVNLYVGGQNDGFTTALMQMHIGDRWKMYIPYNLGYGTSGYTSIGVPGYSLLIYEIKLVAYYRANATPNSSRSTDGGTWIYK